MIVIINYFYFPPLDSGVSPIPELISREPAFLGLTILGIILAISRCFDAVTDPIVANLSDRSKHRFGRRRIFMIIAILPLAFTSLFVFIPPDNTPSLLNVLWVGSCSILAYFFMTMYVVPFTALVSELGKTSEDRVFIATCNSVAWALAFGVGQLIWWFKAELESRFMLSPMEAIQYCATGFSLLGVLAMLVPIFAIDENKYCDGHSCDENLIESMKSAFKNRNFRNFTFGNSLTYMATFFLEAGVIYYVSMLLGMEEASASIIMLVVFIASFALYPLIVKLTKRFQKRSMQVFALVLQGVLFALIPLSTFAPYAQQVGLGVIIAIAIPTAVNSILPTAMLADISKSDGNRTGSYKEGLFFGTMNFSMKLAVTLTTLIFPSVIIIGSDSFSPTTFGVGITAYMGATLSFIAAFFFYRYNEHEVNAFLTVEPTSAEKSESHYALASQQNIN